MEAHTQMESVFATVLGQVLVGADTAGLQSLRGDLFPLIRHEMHAKREVIRTRLLATQIEDTDLGI